MTPTSTDNVVAMAAIPPEPPDARLSDPSGRQDAEGRRGADAQPARIAEECVTSIGSRAVGRPVVAPRGPTASRQAIALGMMTDAAVTPRRCPAAADGVTPGARPAQEPALTVDRRDDATVFSRSYGEAGGGGGGGGIGPGCPGGGGGSGCQPPPSARYSCASARRLVAPGLRQLQFQQEQLLIGDQDLSAEESRCRIAISPVSDASLSAPRRRPPVPCVSPRASES